MAHDKLSLVVAFVIFVAIASTVMTVLVIVDSVGNVYSISNPNFNCCNGEGGRPRVRGLIRRVRLGILVQAPTTSLSSSHLHEFAPMKSTTLVWLVFVLGIVDPAFAEQADWAEGLLRHNDGANREFYNAGAILPWKHFMGDWRDANDTEQGDATYAITKVVDNDTRKPVNWDVTTLLKEWADGKHPNQGMFLRITDGRGPIMFGSRESPDATLRPKLKLTGKAGTVSLDPVADTHLTKSTYRSQGQADQLRVSAAPDHLLIRFDLKQASKIGAISKATLVLQTTKQFGSASIGVFRCRQGHDEPPSFPALGIAARYGNDRGIADDPDVIFATGFERANWQSEWTQAEPRNRIDTIDVDRRFEKFQPLQGKALRSRIAKGSTTALNTLFKFDEQIGHEPEEIYFRYYLRLADDWNQTVQGGKLPGISGTYGRAGWGGRKSNGKNGWSARGLFKMTVPAGRVSFTKSVWSLPLQLLSEVRLGAPVSSTGRRSIPQLTQSLRR
jgi:hypothetical protein